MQKDKTYHQSAIEYNDALAVAAEEQAEKVEHPVIKKWCTSVAKQHRFHSKRHARALEKLKNEESQAVESSTDKTAMEVVQ